MISWGNIYRSTEKTLAIVRRDTSSFSRPCRQTSVIQRSIETDWHSPWSTHTSTPWWRRSPSPVRTGLFFPVVSWHNWPTNTGKWQAMQHWCLPIKPTKQTQVLKENYSVIRNSIYSFILNAKKNKDLKVCQKIKIKNPPSASLQGAATLAAVWGCT